jgi:hypothetical protein
MLAPHECPGMTRNSRLYNFTATKYYVHDFMESQLEIPVSLSTVARGFGCSRNRGTQAFLYGLEPPEARGRYLALAADAKHEILT